MQAIGDPKCYSWMPSIGQIIRATPKALVAVLATFNGLSNTARAAPTGQHGGGLTTEAYADFEQKLLPQIRTCLNAPWARHFDSDSVATECLLGAVKQRVLPSDEVMLSRVAYHHEIPSKDAVSPHEVLTPGAGKKLLTLLKDIVKEDAGFQQVLDEAELQLFFHSNLESLSDLSSTATRYSANDLFTLLEDGTGVDTFKSALHDSSLSFRIHQIVKHAGGLVDRLRPELSVTVTDRDRFETWLDTHFTSTPDDAMNDGQLHSLLLLLAPHINAKYGIGEHWVS